MDTIKIKEIAEYFKMLAKVFPDAPVYMSSDEEGNSYSTIEKSTGKSFSSFAIIPTKDKKSIKSVIIYPWREGLTDEEVGLLEDE